MRTRFGSRGALIGCLLVLASGGAPGEAKGDSEFFELVELGFPDRALAPRVADVDGDGKLDLSWVFTAVDDLEDYALRTCLQAPAPRFSVCTELDLPADARAFDIGEIDGRRGAELLLLTESGARLASFGGGRFSVPAPLAGMRSLFGNTDEGAPLAIRVLFDVDGDGRSEAILPRAEGLALHRPRSDGPKLGAAQVLESPAKVRYRLNDSGGHDLASVLHRPHTRPVAAEATAPAIFVEDFDGDGRRDVVTIAEDQLRVFVQAPNGDFASQPTATIERSVLSEAEKETEFAGEALAFADLDGDGPADLIVLKWGSSDERTQMDRHLFFARGALRYPEKADQIVRSESFFPDFEISDLNGDGRSDLVIPFFHIAPAQAFKAMTQNSLRVQLRLFLMREDGRFGQGEGKAFAMVDRRIVLDYHLDVIGMIFDEGRRPERGFDPLLTMRGDFNGDGFADLAADSGDDELRIYWGNAEGRYSGSPDHTVKYESALASELADLNGDGKTDVIAYYGRAASGWQRTGEPRSFDKRRRERERRQRRQQETGAQPSGPAPESRIKLLISR